MVLSRALRREVDADRMDTFLDCGLKLAISCCRRIVAFALLSTALVVGVVVPTREELGP